MNKALNEMGTMKGLEVMVLNRVMLGLEKKYLKMILFQEDAKFHQRKYLFQMVLNAIAVIF